ncbi:MAG TPA: Xaa-Pro peptidase family protein [Syntrophales bacterium]|nr:Xaa-Pro peptidase family protein [Syntrophales bacterium]
MEKTPKKELYRRIQALQMRMESANIDGALIVQNADLFYFTGTIQQAYLFIPPAGEPVFFVRKNIVRVKEESFLNRIITIEKLKDLPLLLAEQGYQHINRLGMELDVLPANLYFRYRDTMKPAEIVDIWPSIQTVRAVKSSYEIGLLKEVAALSDFMVDTGRENLREGLTDVELSSIVEGAARARGHQGFVRTRAFNQEVYWGHLISGPDAADPAFVDGTTGGRGLSHAFPHGSGWRHIRRNEPVIFDLLAAMHGYFIDQTRTFSLGPLPDKLDKAYNVALDIQHRIGEMIRPGVSVAQLFSKAKQIAQSHGLGEHFMGHGNEQLSYCGHGIGLELDEFPVIAKQGKTLLMPGMVVALEPKFHFPKEGVVGVEDTFVVMDKENRKLTGTSYLVDAAPR